MNFRHTFAFVFLLVTACANAGDTSELTSKSKAEPLESAKSQKDKKQLSKSEKAAIEKSELTKLSKCEQINLLIKGHSNDFERVRTKVTHNKFGDIWDAKYHLVGKNCQVLRWSNNKYSYTCSLTSHNESLAMERYTTARDGLATCLGKEWTLDERKRPAKKGMIATFSSSGTKTVVSTQAFETNGLFNDEWTNYIFVGSKERIK